MPANRGDKFNDRAAAAAAAKKALIENFRAKPPADDPAVQARAAERRAIAEARGEKTVRSMPRSSISRSWLVSIVSRISSSLMTG